MTVEINCTSHLREVLGKKKFRVEIAAEGGEVCIGEVLRNVEGRTAGAGILLLKDDRFSEGLLVFKRTKSGGLERVFESSAPVFENDSLTLATGMEGG